MNDERSEVGTRAPHDAPSSTLAASAAWVPPAPPPPGPPAPGAVPGGRSNRALLAAAVAGALIAGAAIGVFVGLLTRGSHPTSAAAASPGSSSAGAATVQARALYLDALAATRGSAGFHYVAASTGSTATQTIVGDAGQSGGRQVITIDDAAGREQFTLVLVSGTVYFQGNILALEDQLGVPAASAAGLEGKWVSVSDQDGPYGVVAPGITIADQTEETALVPTSTAPIRTAGGASATRILGTVPQQGAPAGTGHLDVAASSHLPISYVSTVSISGLTTTSTTTFSGWGTAAVVTAPAGAVAWSTLGAAAPPGGYGSGGFSLTPSPSSTPQL
jgi:hypothetical protein